jgi:transcriptional regulator with XRE-family HTH domain
MEELVEKMRKYMHSRDLRGYELARKLGTTEANVSRWLSGKHKISKAWQELIKLRLDLET